MSLTTPRLLLSCAVLGATLLASGCGFHLRGTGVDSVELNQLDVSAHNRYGPTYQQVLQALEIDGVKVTPTAPYQLQLDSGRVRTEQQPDVPDRRPSGPTADRPGNTGHAAHLRQ